MTPTIDDTYGIDDLLEQAHLVEPDVLSLKDGSFLAAWEYTGIDYDARVAAIEAATRDFMAAQMDHGRGWALETNVFRRRAAAYPTWGEFPDAVSALIEEERRHYFLKSGDTFRTRYFLSLTYTPPSLVAEKARGWFYEDSTEQADAGLAARALARFRDVVGRWERLSSRVLTLARLGTEELREPETDKTHLCSALLRYVRAVVTDRDTPVLMPALDMPVDHLLTSKRLTCGTAPRLGRDHLRVVAIDSYPQFLYPGALRILERLPIEFRLHGRALFLDRDEALALLSAHKSRHSSKVRNFWARVASKDPKPNEMLNTHALGMAAQADLAHSITHDQSERWALFSANLVLLRADLRQMEADISTLESALFSRCELRVEEDNAVDAWNATLPGHIGPNARRGLLRTVNVSSCLPWHATWTGFPNAPSPIVPPGSPPLVIGSTPSLGTFAGNIHVDDVGHTVCIAPTGAGKSTIEALHAVSFRRYPGTRIYLFDRKRTKYVLTRALGGAYFDYGRGHSPKHCPLQFLDTEGDRAWAASYLEVLCKMNGLAITSEHREELGKAIMRMGERDNRSLTHLLTAVRDMKLREALNWYTINNTQTAGILDGTSDPILESDWTCFEMFELLNMHPNLAIAVQLHLFRRITRSATTDHLTGIFVDEARELVQHEYFGPFLTQQLTELRNLGGFVWMSFQSIEQIVASPLRAVIEEQCKSRLYGPNAHAMDTGTDGTGPLHRYRAWGLNDIQIKMIQSGEPKREYFWQSSDRDKVKGSTAQDFVDAGHFAAIRYEVDPVARLFLSANTDAARARVDHLIDRFGPGGWQGHWIRENGHPDWADHYERLAERYRREAELVA